MKEVKFYTYYKVEWTEYHNIWYREMKKLPFCNIELATKLPDTNPEGIVTKENSSVFYRKIIPENISEILVYPLSLLVWYYDDGSKRTDCNAARIATQSWTYNEHLLLENCLLKNFNLKVNIVRSGISKRTKL